MGRFPDIDWYCDSCNDCLNSQGGFDDACGSWTCTDCGYSNVIAASEIIWGEGDPSGAPWEDSDEPGWDEPGCRACGNPAYPNCKSSCPMFD